MNATRYRWLPLSRAAGFLLAAAVLSARALPVTLSFDNPPSGTLTNGTLVPVNVIASTDGAPVIVSATLNFRTLAPNCTNTWNALSMVTNASPTNFTTTLPRLPAGDINFYASCTYINEGGGSTSTVVSVTRTNTVGESVGIERNENFQGSWLGSGSNFYNSTGWTGTCVAIGMKLGGIQTDPNIPVNSPINTGKYLWLLDYTNAYMQTPQLIGGVGTIYFEAVIRKTYASAMLQVQISSDASAWQTVYTTNLSGSTVARPQLAINSNTVQYVRFLRSQNDPADPSPSNPDSAIIIDNVRLSYPPADLQLIASTNPVTPLYPESLGQVTLRCNLQDTTTNEPTINRRVTLFYTWVSTNGATTNSSSLAMTNAPGTLDDYSAVVSGLDAGTNWYYYRCDFDGYYYTNSDKRGPYYLSASGQTSTNVIPTTNRFSYLINAANVRAIRLLPLTDLAFGQCATNDTRVRTLRICNDGNMPLAVTNIVFGGLGFTTSFTTNFDVAVNSTQSVTVTFAPQSLGPYSDWLWVQSDKTTGTDSNLVTGFGMPIEAITTPAVVGATAGTLWESLSFDLSPAATDSWGYVVQTAYDWGDGTTSAWSVVTATNHFWSTNGTFYVRAQGRSSTNNAVLSDWSASVTVTITNTRIMALAGNLDFGAVGVNAQPLSRLLTVTNSGNGPLTVSDVTSTDPAFSCAPTNFVIPAFGSSNVTVTFTPPAINAYTSLITVVSDKTSGWNTTNATGVGEQLAIISLAPPVSAATLLPQQLSFTVAGSNSAAHAMNYRFDWGDGSISGWSALTNGSHGWTNAGPFSVMAQAQCQTDTNALSPWSAPVSVTITNTRILGLIGNLSFGIVVTNLSSNLVLAVTNSGNGSLSVSDITITNTFFSILSATSFVLPAFGSTNVMVRFLPTAPGYYTDLVVVAANNTSGSNTIKVTGIGEMVGKPTLSPTNTAGTLGQNISFTAAATNNTGDLLNYRFDWGTGTTSGWTSATATNAWYETNTFSIRAQAQCRTHTNALSDWSDAATLTITNARSISMSATNLLFGDLMTNQTRDVILTISNSGNASFSVTSISTPAGFSALPQAFTIAVSNSVVVTNTFAPSAPGSYSGTVVITSPEAGGRIYTVTGFCETISAPVLSGVLGGHTNDTLTFSASATNNSGHTIEYYYDWGDGAVSNWTSATNIAHVWATTNAFPVLVQARCQAYTNVVSAWSATNIVNVYAAPLFTFSTVTNGLPFQVTMTATGAAPGTVSNCVFYFLPPGSTNIQATNLTFISGNDWKATVPPLNSGSMGYYLQYMRSGVQLRYPAIVNNNWPITNYMGKSRQEDFQDGWTTNSTTPVYTCSSIGGWTGWAARVGMILGGISTDPNVPVNSPVNSGRYLFLLNTNDAVLQTPVYIEGIGTIYFEAVIRTSGGYRGNFAVEVSTNSGGSWESVYTNLLIGSTILRPAVTLNLRMPAAIRFRRTSAMSFSDDNANYSAIVLDNIRISPPPTDVHITELLKNPGYPNSKDPTLVRCQTADYDPVNAPSVSRRLTVYYKYESAASFTPTNMVAIGSSTYEGVIPVLSPGVVSYYFACAFDGFYYSNNIYAGTALANLYPSERITPAYLPDQRPGPVYATYPTPTNQAYGSTLPEIPTYTIRFFRSEHAGMRLQTTPSSVATDMELVGDYLWQGLTLMTGITNITWHFVGTLPYSNNATSFGSSLSWGDTNQDFPYPPMGGTADLTPNLTTNALRATLEYEGMLIYRFTSTNANYLVKRAVYQNFNTWQASQDYFEASLGLYATTTFTNDFTTWGTNYFDPVTKWKSEAFSSEPLNLWYSTPYPTTVGLWNREQAMAIAERDISAVANRALWLNNSTNAPGRVWNTSGALTEGIHNFTFRARLAQNDGRYALYTRELPNLDVTNCAWATGYRVTNTIRAVTMSPANASVSLMLCYRRDIYNPLDTGSFYELRLSQVSDTGATDARMQMQLFRWSNGVNVKSVYGPSVVSSQRLTDSPSLQLDVFWTNVSDRVQFYVNAYRSLPTVPLFIPVWTTNLCYELKSAGAITNGGLVGFLCTDAEAEISALDVYRGTNLDVSARIDMVGYNSTDSYPPGSCWFFGGKRTSDNQNWWQTNVAGSAGNLMRPIPPYSPKLSLNMIRTGITGLRDPDRVYWTNSVSSFSVSSFGYTSLSKAFNIWDETYVMLQFTNGDLPVIVDDLTIDPWRAYTRGYADSNWNADVMATADGVVFWNWTNNTQQYVWGRDANRDWAIFEGLVVKSAGNNYVSFDSSRANPDLSQGIWSPVLNNGLGSIAFRAFSGAGTNVYRVQYRVEDDTTFWLDVQTFTNQVTDAPVNRFVTLQKTNLVGRIRIRQDPTQYTNGVWSSGSSPGAILNIDDLVARDYPPPDATTWQAYNCLIARPSTNNNTQSRAFETNALAFDRQTCYLNNGVTNGVLFPGILNADNPYIQTPRVDTGIGEIAFWYRAWDSNPAYLSIQVAADATATGSQWTVIDSFPVTNQTYLYYSPTNNIYYIDKHVMRVYVTNSIPSTTTGRLCIDNVLMAEPVRPGFEITGVTLLPTQPLATDAVGVRATIGRFLMNPQGIRLYLGYVVGTNTWGAANWWGSGVEPNPGIPRLELSNTADRVYTSLGTNFIPAMNIDTVVQFMVWGVYSNMDGRPFFMTTNVFVNPSWYAPVNLNNTHAAQGWSPYYYVYSCPTGSVWFNEINYAIGTPERTNEYVEVIGPANARLGNWRIELLPANQSVQTNCTITNTFILTNTFNGWGFFVWGDTAVPNANLKFAPPQNNNIPTLGGAKLYRSMGAIEDMVCWGDPSLTIYGYRYAGTKSGFKTSGLALEGGPTNGGSSKLQFNWNQPSSGNYTPGRPNTDQNLASAPVIPTFLYCYLTSLVGPHGRQNGSSNALVSVQLSLGASTSITYTADSWYRIGTLTTNGAGIPAASGTTQYTWSVTNISGNVSNNATFSILPGSYGSGSSNVPVSWLAGFGMPEAMAFDNDQYLLTDEYMLNMSPYIANDAVTFVMDAIAITGATVNVTVKLLESTNGVTYVQPCINGTLNVYSTTNLAGGWTNVASTNLPPPSQMFDAGGRKVFSFPGDTNRFYQAKIQ